MIAALGTLPFVATIWLLVVLGAATLEESGAKIAAALKGHSPGFSRGHLPKGRLRRRTWMRRPRPAPSEWRDAA